MSVRSELLAVTEALLTSAKGGFCLTDLGEEQADQLTQCGPLSPHTSVVMRLMLCENSY